MDKKIVTDALKLVAIVLVAVLCLSVVYATTKGVIAKAEEEEKIESYRTVLPAAVTFEKAEYDKPEGVAGSIEVIDVLYANDESGEKIGTVLSLRNPNGYGGDIVISVGFDLSGTVTGMKVTEMSESPGLGANCTEESFREQFTGLKNFPVSYVKNRSGEKAKNEFDAISGATITTDAIKESVNFAYDFIQSVFGFGGEA